MFILIFKFHCDSKERTVQDMFVVLTNHPAHDVSSASDIFECAPFKNVQIPQLCFLCDSAQQEMNGPEMILGLCWCQSRLSVAAAVCHCKAALYLRGFVWPEPGSTAELVAFPPAHRHCLAQ